MKNDFSEKVLHKYFLLQNTKVKITLKNKQEIIGKIAGYIYGDEYGNDYFISQWRIIIENETTEKLDYLFEPRAQAFIAQQNIQSFYFFEDKTSLP